MLKKILVITIIIFILTSCQSESDYVFGYIEGRYTYIATNYGGILEDLYVQRGDEVSSGAPLFKLESQPEAGDVLKAKAEFDSQTAKIDSLRADYDLQKLIVNRREKLLKQNYTPEEEVDVTRVRRIAAISQLISAKYNVEFLRANYDIAEFRLSKKSGFAPFKGLVFDTFYTKGELVTPGTPIMALLHPDEVKVIFFMPAKKLSLYKLGDVIRVNCDSCKETVDAKIVFISDKAEFTPPVIFSNETRSKLVFRMEAKPLVDTSYKALHPGQPVQIYLNKK